jgi:hypothetical protein
MAQSALRRASAWIGFSALLLAGQVLRAQEYRPPNTKSITESVEWTWAQTPKHVDPALPNVLLLGDSITRRYYARVASLLEGRMNCYLFATSASAGDPRLGRQLDDYLRYEAVPFAVIHFNNGMHGLGLFRPGICDRAPRRVCTTSS